MSAISRLRSQDSGANLGALVLIIVLLSVGWVFVSFYIDPPWNERTGLLIAYVATYVSVVAGFASVRGVWVNPMGVLSLGAALVALYAVGAAPATELAEQSWVPTIVGVFTAVALAVVELGRRFVLVKAGAEKGDGLTDGEVATPGDDGAPSTIDPAVPSGGAP